eukprot:COSAG05_NODE_3941_length_1762_cov_9.592303_2_plen_90_part_01
MRVQQEAVAIEQWAEKYRIPDFSSTVFQTFPVQYNVRNTRVVKNAGPDLTGLTRCDGAVMNSEAVTSLWQQQAAVDRELAKKRGTLRERK